MLVVIGFLVVVVSWCLLDVVVAIVVVVVSAVVNGDGRYGREKKVLSLLHRIVIGAMT